MFFPLTELWRGQRTVRPTARGVRKEVAGGEGWGDEANLMNGARGKGSPWEESALKEAQMLLPREPRLGRSQRV